MRLFSLLLLWVAFNAAAQNPGYWQQHADYKIDVAMDVSTYRYSGKQSVVYTNNAPDTLHRVFFHLYPNAFRPGSEMDIRLQYIKDPDARMVSVVKKDDGTEIKESRIKNLKPNEMGMLKVLNFRQDGVAAKLREAGTILEVVLAKPLLPGAKTTFVFDFEGQVPVQIRRSGRNNKEGVELSMSQWYPKLAEYDFEGWHPDPYIAREFHGVWGNFDVKITIDKNYVLGGTGYLQNADQIGHGYQAPGKTVMIDKKTKNLTWHFIAPDVHDFTWAADKNYLHDTVQVPDGPTLHFLYKNNPKILENWKNLQPKAVELMQFYSSAVGKYPYKQYSVIQGGDGGMEYAMCTLILGEGKFDGLLGVTAHEMAHSWFQHILATNEGKHGWMDEGFTSFIEDLALNEISDKKQANPFLGSYAGYLQLANSGKEQSQSTHADRFDENRVYSISSYSKGSVFVTQLAYLIGWDNLMKTIRRFYEEFKFKHPTPNDFKRVAEKTSGALLDWYLSDWTMTTNTIDYRIAKVENIANLTTVNLERVGRTPMPIDLLVEYNDGSKESFYIPLRMMHFEKENPSPEIKRTVLQDWFWTNPKYQFNIAKPLTQIKSITIDPSGLMADIKPENNRYKP
jgi:hypothetical protein